jgi:hypothetical protein
VAGPAVWLVWVITAAPAIHAHKQVGRDGVAKGLGLLPTGTGCTRSHLRVELTTTLQWGGSVDERRAGRVSTLVRTLELGVVGSGGVRIGSLCITQERVGHQALP